MKSARYKVTLDSTVHGHDATKWDTEIEAFIAVASIVQESSKLMDGIRRTVRVVYRRKVLRTVVIQDNRAVFRYGGKVSMRLSTERGGELR